MAPSGALVLLCGFIAAAPPDVLRMPMAVDFENTAEQRWLGKEVQASRLLDDMEDSAHWSRKSTFGYTESVAHQGPVTLTGERFRDGSHSIRLKSKTKGDKRGPQMGRPFGSASIIRRFGAEDWSPYNRLSFWVYPDLPGFHTVSLMVALHNEGEVKLPGPARLGLHFLDLKNQTWNHVVWEIPDLPRDKVTGVEFQYRLQGNEPGATDTVTFDIDHLELQRIEADYYEGWPVAPGRIAYCQAGYQPDSPKAAIASGMEATVFEVLDQQSGRVVVSKAVKTTKTPLGEYQVMDFSELTQPGSYVLRAGRQSTRPFRVSADVWSSTVWKAVNYFYCQRCGTAIPGIHDLCHQDWQGVHGHRTIIINGGWHDAGDLSQGLTNTCEAIAAMLGLAEQLRAESREPALADRLVEEARWGLAWVLKNNFGGGYRVAWATHDFWTNNKIGDVDDVFAKATNAPRDNFTAATTEAIACRVMRTSDPGFAGRCLASAKDDWRFAAEIVERPGGLDGLDSISPAASPLDVAAAGVLASVELFHVTGQKQYAELAVKLAKTVVDCQQRTYLPGLKQPLAGFFYASPARKDIYHSDHRGHDHAPIMALAALCRALPNHDDWIEWYSAVVYYSEYLKAIAAYTEPYGVLPASLYRDDEYLRIPKTPPRKTGGNAEATQEDFREQVENGIDMGGGYHLRRFPVWFMRRGQFGVLLTQTKALSAAAQLRGNAKAAQLAQRQLQWIVGCNPFGQSTMYGEGHDYLPHYSAMSGQIVGSLPVGIGTLLNHDAPYWPVHNHMNPKETWVYPVAHWLSVMNDLAGPTPRTKRMTVTHVVEGRHASVRATVQGKGRHDLVVCGDNVRFDEPRRQVSLPDERSETVTWQGTILSAEAPWVAVVVPDLNVSQASESISAPKNDSGAE